MLNATTNADNNEMGIHSITGKCETDLTNKAEAAGAPCMNKGAESATAHTVGGAGSTIGAKANEAIAAVGSGMKSLAGTIREHAPKDSTLRTASSSLAESLESGGRYLQQEGLGGMAKDITNLVRRNPVPALLVGVGIGFLLAKVTSSVNNGN